MKKTTIQSALTGIILGTSLILSTQASAQAITWHEKIRCASSHGCRIIEKINMRGHGHRGWFRPTHRRHAFRKQVIILKRCHGHHCHRVKKVIAYRDNPIQKVITKKCHHGHCKRRVTLVKRPHY